jgi:hypothetical protein
MLKSLTLEYWIEDGWYIGRLKEVPSVLVKEKRLPIQEESHVCYH